MNLRKLIISALLLAAGLILHQIAPPILFNMRPDMLLSMMFITILINDDYKMTLVVGLASGLLSAMTTTFPNGQLPNIIDKLITSSVVFVLFKFTGKLNHHIKLYAVSILGTILSGAIFLTSAALLSGLPGGASITLLMLTVVLPAALINTAGCIIIYNAVMLAMKRVRYNSGANIKKNNTL